MMGVMAIVPVSFKEQLIGDSSRLSLALQTSYLPTHRCGYHCCNSKHRVDDY